MLGTRLVRLARHPEHCPVVLSDVRRVVLRGFPYSLLFRTVDSTAWVVACFHSSRDPKTWQSRR